MRDELSPLPFVRGTVGMALSGRDTGGSQFFITRVAAAAPGRAVHRVREGDFGWDTLDQVTLWDVIDRIRIWDGTEKTP